MGDDWRGLTVVSACAQVVDIRNYRPNAAKGEASGARWFVAPVFQRECVFHNTRCCSGLCRLLFDCGTAPRAMHPFGHAYYAQAPTSGSNRGAGADLLLAMSVSGVLTTHSCNATPLDADERLKDTEVLDLLLGLMQNRHAASNGDKAGVQVRETRGGGGGGAGGGDKTGGSGGGRRSHISGAGTLGCVCCGSTCNLHASPPPASSDASTLSARVLAAHLFYCTNLYAVAYCQYPAAPRTANVHVMPPQIHRRYPPPALCQMHVPLLYSPLHPQPLLDGH